MTITCSTKVCSFGKQVVEKVETEFPVYENGRYVYKIHRSAMCEYMINFIHKLKHLPEKFMMNSVLENFTILQVKSILVFGRIYFFLSKILKRFLSRLVLFFKLFLLLYKNTISHYPFSAIL